MLLFSKGIIQEKQPASSLFLGLNTWGINLGRYFQSVHFAFWLTISVSFLFLHISTFGMISDYCSLPFHHTTYRAERSRLFPIEQDFKLGRYTVTYITHTKKSFSTPLSRGNGVRGVDLSVKKFCKCSKTFDRHCTWK